MKHTACRRVIALALIFVMLAAILPVTASAAGNPRFDDVSPADWFYSSVETVCAKGLMTGTSARTFRPALPVTRGMLVTILYRLENYPKTASGSPFADVAAGSYYEKAIRWAAANKIVTGYDAAHFGPDDALTREQLAAILYRYAEAMGYDVSSGLSHTLYADAAEVSGYAQTAVDWAIAEGFLKGKDGWKLCPKAAATRAELAVILTRYCAYAEPQAAARLKTLLTAAASRPDRDPDANEEPETGLSIRFDRAETVTTQPSVTLTGSYVSDADVASITYMLTGEYSDFLDETGDVTYADGRWEITDLRIVPDSSTVTLMITDADGNTAAATGSVYYDLGELVDAELVKVAQDEETGLIFASNILLVYFADEASDADKAAVAQSVGGTVVGQDNFMNMQQLMVAPVTLEEAIQVADNVKTGFPETVVMAMFDVAFTDSSLSYNDPWEVKENGAQNGESVKVTRGPEGWDESAPKGTNWGLEAIEALSAWELYGAEFKPILVGVVDNMFDTTHEDLEGKISFPDADAEKRNSRNLKEIPDAHGTHVSGIIAATANNGKGITGVAHNAKIIAYPYSEVVVNNDFDEAVDVEFTSELEKGLIQTVLAGAKVINFSVSLTGTVTYRRQTMSPSYNRVLKESARMSSYAVSLLLDKYLPEGRDFLVVQAAGNGTRDGTACDATKAGIFASIDEDNNMLVSGITLNQVLDRIIVVGNAQIDTAVDGVYEESMYIQNPTSNAGDRVDLCAPGTRIASCSLMGVNDNYELESGTSQAAPHVTGVAALVWSANDALTAPQVKQILCSSYRDWVKDNFEMLPYNSLFTGGTFPMVNARLAVKKALEMKPSKTSNLRATIVEGPTAKGMTAASVSAQPSDMFENYIRLNLEWDSNPCVQKTFIAAMQASRSFTKSEIEDAIEFYPDLWREEVGEQPEDMPLEQRTSQHFPWTDDKGYPIYVLLLNMDREYNVLGYTIVKVEQV